MSKFVDYLNRMGGSHYSGSTHRDPMPGGRYYQISSLNRFHEQIRVCLFKEVPGANFGSNIPSDRPNQLHAKYAKKTLDKQWRP
jgi:hypothetical protein